MPRAEKHRDNRQSAAGSRKKRRKRFPKDRETLGSGLSAVVDELYQIDWMLQALPDIRIAVTLADRALDPRCRGAAAAPDRLAEWAREAFGVDLDAEDEDESRSKMNDPNLSDLPSVLSTIIDAARWRLLRVAKVVSMASSAMR